MGAPRERKPSVETWKFFPVLFQRVSTDARLDRPGLPSVRDVLPGMLTTTCICLLRPSAWSPASHELSALAVRRGTSTGAPSGLFPGPVAIAPGAQLEGAVSV